MTKCVVYFSAVYYCISVYTFPHTTIANQVTASLLLYTLMIILQCLKL